jgi:hypothetical protein
MGKAKKKRNNKAQSAIDRVVRPTEQREAANDFRSAGMAVKVIPPIETLYSAGKISERQFKGLARYADVANAAERSHIKSNIDFSVYGSGEGLPHFGVRMNIELGYLNRALGSLQDIAEAVCVREVSVSQWAMERGGSVMRERPGIGRAFIRWFEPKRKHHEIAMLEIRMAGERLAAAIAA